MSTATGNVRGWKIVSIGALAFFVVTHGLAGCASPTTPNASSYTLSGVVSTGGVGVPFGLPVEGVRIRVEGPRFRLDATTDKNGRYAMSGAYAGTSYVSASRDGYEPYTGNLMIAGDDPRLNIGLVPRAIYTLSGVVSEMTQTGLAPIEGAGVSLGYKDGGMLTDKNGFYSISQLYPPPIVFHAGFGKAGYQPQELVVTIDGNTRLDIQLVRR